MTTIYEGFLHTADPGSRLIHLSQGNPGPLLCNFDRMEHKPGRAIHLTPTISPTWMNVNKTDESITHASFWHNGEWMFTIRLDKPARWKGKGERITVCPILQMHFD